ncbi:MAG: chemotaxis protein CheX [Armatimonadetes bacterium]|nr:chemotaxis protein CheX [Armatimonadota bacterium]
MQAKFVNPFVSGAQEVVGMVLAVEPSLGQLAARPRIFTSQQFNVTCGITGDLAGQIIYGMSLQTAEAITKKMLGDALVPNEELAASALSELGNMISGTCSSKLHSAGYTCDITPPTIIQGTNVSISTIDIPALVIPLNLPGFGVLEINVSLKERAVAQAA